jgi:hypothetical protein
MNTAGRLEDRLAHAFRRVLGRRPTDYDLAALARMHDRQLAAYRSDPEAAKKLLAVGESGRAAPIADGAAILIAPPCSSRPSYSQSSSWSSGR